MTSETRIHTYHSVASIAGQIFGGSSLLRALFNESIKAYSLSGNVLDLGSKSRESSYYSYIQVQPDAKITFTDLVAASGVVQLDIEEKFPFDDQQFDQVIAFHVLEHVYGCQKSVGEMARVLKDGGELIVSMPFIYKYHPDPDDYYRFTDSALSRLGDEYGLRCKRIEYVGEGLFTMFLTSIFRFGSSTNKVSNFLQTIAYLVASPIDRLIQIQQSTNRQGSRTIAQLYALEHIAVFEKA